MIRIDETGGLTGVVSAEYLRSILGPLRVGAFEDWCGNGRGKGDGNLSHIRGCVDRTGRRSVLWIERSRREPFSSGEVENAFAGAGSSTLTKGLQLRKRLASWTFQQVRLYAR